MNNPSNPRFKLSLRDTLRILGPYLRRKLAAQIKGIWFIVSYLIVFQLLVLRLPIVYAATIALGIAIVAVGLAFFMEGLRLGLMPLGDAIGRILPKKAHISLILLFAFLLGVGATLAEPAIAVLKAAGAGVSPHDAPLLYSLLRDYPDQLVVAVGVGVGLAVTLGVLRFFRSWHLKYMAIGIVAGLLLLSIGFSQVPHLSHVLGLAWDCGAVTTGPVTVPLVLALGIGVSRVVSSGSGGGSGFGIVTLASLFPIIGVMVLSLYHFQGKTYYGEANYQGAVAQEQVTDNNKPTYEKRLKAITQEEFSAYQKTGILPPGAELVVTGTPRLENGTIVLSDIRGSIKKLQARGFSLFDDKVWDQSTPIFHRIQAASLEALRATIPLCIFLFLVLRVFLKQKMTHSVDLTIGIIFTFLGMALFSLGIALGLTPLGAQLGSNVPLTFAQVAPWGSSFLELPLFSEHGGKVVAIIFAFFLGYGATLAEPALNALGETVEQITVGAFRKQLLMHTVAIGVGIGLGAGILKMAYNLPLIWLVLPAYSVVLVLTHFSPHTFVNFGWDSAGVTTGPITVPLVLAMGLGVGANIPGVVEGFGILALASVGPILTVLSVGLYTQRKAEERNEPTMQERQTETKEAA